METMDKDGLESMDWTEGQVDWRAGNMEKSKPGAERSREMADRQGTAGLAEAGVEEGLEGLERASATTVSAPGTWTMSLVNSEM